MGFSKHKKALRLRRKQNPAFSQPVSHALRQAEFVSIPFPGPPWPLKVITWYSGVYGCEEPPCQGFPTVKKKYTGNSDVENVVLVEGWQRIVASHQTSNHHRQEDNMTEHTDHRERQAQLKATYGALYDRLVDILYVADLAGISHFSKDEYEPEVATILPRLSEATCEADVERIIREEFAYWFYPGMTEYAPERYVWAARQMWQV